MNKFQKIAYQIAKDDSKITDEDLEGFEEVMYDLDEIENDKYASFAHAIARNQANGLDFEGIGYPLVKGRNNFASVDSNEHIDISSIDEDYEDIEVEEVV